MSAPHQMTDEQRRAMFARMGGGSSAGSHAVSVYGATGDSDDVAYQERMRRAAELADQSTSKWSAFWSGFGSGAWDGTKIALNNLTHGLADKLGWTDAKELVEKGGTAYAVSDLASTIGSVALESAALGGAGASLSKLSSSVLTYPKSLLPAALKSLEALASAGKAMVAFRAGDAIDAFRNDRLLNPYLDKGLAVIGEAADIYGGYQLATGFGQLGGALRRIPLFGNQLVTRVQPLVHTRDWTEPIMGKVLSPKTVGDLLNGWSKAAGNTIAKPFVSLWQGAEKTAPTLSKLLKEGYGLYTKASEATGGGIGDILSKNGGWTANLARAELAGRAVAEEVVAQKARKDAKAAFDAGETYTIEGTKPRGALATIGMAAVGALGNPIEKMTRKGAWSHAQEQGVYRAKLDVVNDAYKEGRISAGERDSLLRQVASEKPRDMQGKSLYGVQSAMSKFFQWKGGEAASALGSSTLARIQAEDRASAKAKKEAEKAEKARAAAEREEAARILSSAFGISPVEKPKETKTPDTSDTSTFNTINQWLGSGLMYTGHSGVLSPMGGAGTGVAQAWNAVLAGLGAVDYNNRAAKAHDKTYTSPLQSQKAASQKSEQQAAEEILRAAFGL